jgi:phage-related protein
MPQTEILIYRDDDGSVPLTAWLDSLQVKARDRCLDRLALLHEQGHELRRPIAENLGDGLYELRVKFFQVNYRMLYFFHGQTAAVVSHGLAKERAIPPREIKLALLLKKKFEQNPQRHTFHREE